MASDSKEPESDLSAIGQDIVANAASVQAGATDDSLNERLDRLEFFIEENAKARELQETLSVYVSDLTEENRDIKNYRFWITAFSGTMSVSLFGLLFFCMTARPKWFIALDGKLQVPLIIALGGGAVFLMSLLLRGVYRSRHERNHGDMIPEVVKVAVETYKDISGK